VTALFASATAAGLCVALLCRTGPPRLHHHPHPARRVVVAPAGQVPRRREPAAVLVVGTGVGGALLLGALGPSALLLAASAALVAGGAFWLHAAARARRRADQGRRRTFEACDALVAELRAGQPPTHALQRAGDVHSGLRAAARAGVLGGDVPAALRHLSTEPGCAGLATVAAAWQVAERSGSALVPSLQQVSVALRADAELRVEVEASLAPARATARLLAVLPVFGLMLGAGLGGHPVALLVSTPLGTALLLAGAALALTGTVWVERLADEVQA
jgi:tight adherence protein B